MKPINNTSTTLNNQPIEKIANSEVPFFSEYEGNKKKMPSPAKEYVRKTKSGEFFGPSLPHKEFYQVSSSLSTNQNHQTPKPIRTRCHSQEVYPTIHPFTPPNHLNKSATLQISPPHEWEQEVPIQSTPCFDLSHHSFFPPNCGSHLVIEDLKSKQTNLNQSSSSIDSIPISLPVLGRTGFFFFFFLKQM